MESDSYRLFPEQDKEEEEEEEATEDKSEEFDAEADEEEDVTQIRVSTTTTTIKPSAAEIRPHRDEEKTDPETKRGDEGMEDELEETEAIPRETDQIEDDEEDGTNAADQASGGGSWKVVFGKKAAETRENAKAKEKEKVEAWESPEWMDEHDSEANPPVPKKTRKEEEEKSTRRRSEDGSASKGKEGKAKNAGANRLSAAKGAAAARRTTSPTTARRREEDEDGSSKENTEDDDFTLRSLTGVSSRRESKKKATITTPSVVLPADDSVPWPEPASLDLSAPTTSGACTRI
jgi:hypothetical protein